MWASSLWQFFSGELISFHIISCSKYKPGCFPQLLTFTHSPSLTVSKNYNLTSHISLISLLPSPPLLLSPVQALMIAYLNYYSTFYVTSIPQSCFLPTHLSLLRGQWRPDFVTLLPETLKVSLLTSSKPLHSSLMTWPGHCSHVMYHFISCSTPFPLTNWVLDSPPLFVHPSTEQDCLLPHSFLLAWVHAVSLLGKHFLAFFPPYLTATYPSG